MELINRLCCGKYGQNTAKSIEIKIKIKKKRAQENFLNFSQGFLFWRKLTTFHQTPQVFILPLLVMFYHTLWMLFIQIRDEAKRTRVLKETSMQAGTIFAFSLKKMVESCSARYLHRYHDTYLRNLLNCCL